MLHRSKNIIPHKYKHNINKKQFIIIIFCVNKLVNIVCREVEWKLHMFNDPLWGSESYQFSKYQIYTKYLFSVYHFHLFHQVCLIFVFVWFVNLFNIMPAWFLVFNDCESSKYSSSALNTWGNRIFIQIGSVLCRSSLFLYFDTILNRVDRFTLNGFAASRSFSFFEISHGPEKSQT